MAPSHRTPDGYPVDARERFLAYEGECGRAWALLWAPLEAFTPGERSESIEATRRWAREWAEDEAEYSEANGWLSPIEAARLYLTHDDQDTLDTTRWEADLASETPADPRARAFMEEWAAILAERGVQPA